MWQNARKFNKDLYDLIVTLNGLDFKFKSQILSSAGSIMDNITEGFERGGNRELIHFLAISKGSCGECRSQLYRIMDMGLGQLNFIEELIKDTEELSKQIGGFMVYLKNSELKGNKFYKKTDNNSNDRANNSNES